MPAKHINTRKGVKQKDSTESLGSEDILRSSGTMVQCISGSITATFLLMRGLRKGEKESIAKYSLGLRRYYAAAAAWCLRSVRPYTDQTTANTDTDEGAETDSCLVAIEL